jgi:hypothetical protein
VLVAGIGFTLGRTKQAGQTGKDQLGDLVVDSIEAGSAGLSACG